MTVNINPYIAGSGINSWTDTLSNVDFSASGNPQPHSNSEQPLVEDGGTIPSGDALWPNFDGSDDSMYSDLVAAQLSTLNNADSNVVVAQILRSDLASGVFFSIGSHPHDRPRVDFGINNTDQLNVIFYTSNGTNDYERVWTGSTPLNSGIWHGVGFRHNSVDLDLWVSGVQDTVDKSGSTGGSASDWFYEATQAYGEERISFIQLGGSCASGDEPINDWHGGINSVRMVASGTLDDGAMSNLTQSLGGIATSGAGGGGGFPEGAIPIDAGFMTSSGNVGWEPILLTHESGYYYLEQDITASGTAFILGEDDITLDLNGYTITFDEAPLPDFPNSSFEVDASGTLVQDVSNWEIQAWEGGTPITPSGYIHPNDVYFPERSNLLLKVPYSQSHFYKFTSDEIGPLASGINYGAYMLCGGSAGSETDGSQFATEGFINIIDAVSSGTISSGTTSMNAERTSVIHHRFISPTNGNIKIQWDFQNNAVDWTELHFDHAQLRPMQRYGVIAARNHFSDMSSYYGLTSTGQSTYDSNRTNLFKATIKNGIFQQGIGSGLECGAIDFAGLNNVLAYGLDCYLGGLNDHGIIGRNMCSNLSTTLESHPSELIMVSGCRLFYDSEDISNRFAAYSSTTFSFHGTGSESGCISKIVNNVASGYPQAGFTLGTAEFPTYPSIIHGNTLYPNKRCVNGYAVTMNGGNVFAEITNNIIDASGTSWGGRGMFLEGGTTEALVSGVIANNYVFIREHKDRESNNSLNARALRMRNQVDSESVHRDLTIRDNTIIAYCPPNGDDWGNAFGVRLSYGGTPKSDPEGMVDANIVFRNNHFKAISDDSNRNARAFVLDGCTPASGNDFYDYPTVHSGVPGVNLNWYDNTFESNDVSLKITDTDGSHVHDCHFWNSTFRKSNEGYNTDHQCIHMGAGTLFKHITNTSVMGWTLENGAVWNGPVSNTSQSNSYQELHVGPSINIVATSGASIYPVPNGFITVTNASGTDSDNLDIGGSGHYLQATKEIWLKPVGVSSIWSSGLFTTTDVTVTAPDYADYDETWNISLDPIVSGITMDVAVITSTGWDKGAVQYGGYAADKGIVRKER